MKLVSVTLMVLLLGACSNVPGYHGVQNAHGAKELFNNCLRDMLDTRNNRGSGC